MKKVFLNAVLIACVNFVFSQTIALSNDDITGVNNIEINDLGLSEGIEWGNNIDISVDHQATYGFDAFTFRTTNSYPFLFKSSGGTAKIVLKGTSGQGGGGGGSISFGGSYFIRNLNAPTTGGSDLKITHNNGKGLHLSSGRIVVSNKTLFSNVAPGPSNVTMPDDFLLAVDGKAIAEEMWVQNSIQWPDYVFTKDYELRSLNEVAIFITKNSHLPEVPSAKEIEEKGINTGEMHAVLLKKIEELTLYIIENNKQDEIQNKNIEALREENRKLKEELSTKK